MLYVLLINYMITGPRNIRNHFT